MCTLDQECTHIGGPPERRDGQLLSRTIETEQEVGVVRTAGPHPLTDAGDGFAAYGSGLHGQSGNAAALTGDHQPIDIIELEQLGPLLVAELEPDLAESEPLEDRADRVQAGQMRKCVSKKGSVILHTGKKVP